MSKIKILNALLIVTSLIGYLEWGTDNHSFLFQGEYEVLTNLFTHPESAAHPFTLFPLFGQILLFITLFQRKPSSTLTYIGIVCLGLLLGFMFFIGLLGWKIKILCSTLPFLIVAILDIRALRSQKNKNETTNTPVKNESFVNSTEAD